MIDKPEVRIERRAKKFFMPRNNNRVCQTSIDMIRSWRANCDIQILIYDTSPSKPDLREITRVVDYIVGYTCKGGTTLVEEHKTNRSLIAKMEETTGDQEELRCIAKRIMNKAATRRLISKQEACVLLSKLPLTLCSEFITTESIVKNTPIEVHYEADKKPKSEKLLLRYEKRPEELHHMSINDFFHHVHGTSNRQSIPLFTGLSGKPTFPVTESYAKHTLIVYKPWKQYKMDRNWIQEFNEFIRDKRNCPIEARLQYERVMMRHFDGTKYIDPVSAKIDHSENPITECDEAAILLAGMKGEQITDIDSHVFNNIKRGKTYNWSQERMVCKIPMLAYFKLALTTFYSETKSYIRY